jgi:protein required for attachment to host cells
MKTWIVVANAGVVKFLEQADPNDRPELIEALDHPQGRAHEFDLETDSLDERSASKTRHGSGAPHTESTYQPHQTPRQHENELFARDIAARLLKALNENRYESLVLAASPEFLSLLRRLLDHRVTSAVRLELNKDLTKLQPHELHERLRAG